MKKRIAVLLCTFMFWFQIPIHADSITIQDEGIRNAIQRALRTKENSFDLRSLSEVKDLNRFPVRNVQNLKELEHTPHLTKLMIMNSNVEDYTPLQHLDELKSLLITQFKKNDSQFNSAILNKLNLSQLGFQNVNVFNEEHLPKTIRDLSLVNTGMESAAFLEDFKQLERLILRDQRIDASTLSLNHPELQYVTLEGLGLTTLPSTDNLKQLRFANLKNNELKNVDSLSMLPQLKELDLSKNMIADLSKIPSSVSDLKAFDQVAEVEVMEYEGMYTIKNPFKWVDGQAIKPDLFRDDITYDETNHELTLKNLDFINEIQFLKKDLSDGEKMMTGRLKIGRIVKTSPMLPLEPMPQVRLPHVFETSVGSPYSFESLLKDYPEIEAISLGEAVNYLEVSKVTRNLNVVFKTGHKIKYPITLIIKEDTKLKELDEDKPSLNNDGQTPKMNIQNQQFDQSQQVIQNKIGVEVANKSESSVLPKTGKAEAHPLSYILIGLGALLLGIVKRKDKTQIKSV
ncbi:leucine-rich repeat domain-containing protein [Erysipelothrix rhusiopathiae]|uniref:leucine-rich repeat domain-containing protein n=1 Tax=Erysipelothrix rhusiopathiae TaxID=1648 RepID=UPI002B24D87F|nr:leucine-rich repeat domain-containing protein [Erysipelothrix rhusiopathiae]WRB92527.1 leucine-rich repeat domain-containing protein [Erysipelothrix rhusiopathiae]